MVNASNSRFYYRWLSRAQRFHQIGSDQGLLPAPVALSSLTLAPAERADVTVDFSGAAGQRIVLLSQAFSLMQFRVAASAGTSAKSALPVALRSVPKIHEPEAVKTRTLTLNE